MEFNQNDWGQCDIISNIKILTKQGTYNIQYIIPTKHQKYPSTTILENANVLAKINKPP